MATVNNATGVYATLGYNFDDPNHDVNVLSANSQAHLNTMPAFITSWQAQDIANDDVGGYFQNPVATYVNTIITLASELLDLANTANSQNIDGATLIMTAANTLHTDAQSFLAHTNRISGVTPYVGQDLTYPYYQTAMSVGKTAMYITNQTDGIINTSPIMGSFTSILVGPQIQENGNVLAADVVVLNAGVTANNLTMSQINQITSDIANTDSFLTTRQNGDVTYYTNLKSFVNKYNQTKQFIGMGETETYLVNNFVGTDKIKTRINS
jgi:hypothetical protein